MNKKIVLAIALSLVTVLSLTIGIQIASAQKTQIVIGCAESLTGVNAAGTAVHHAYYDMIVRDYDAQGGLYDPDVGKKLNVTLIKLDDQSDEPTCLKEIQELITVNQVDLLFAPWSTAFNVGAFPIYEQYHYPVVAFTVGDDDAARLLINGTYSGANDWCFVTLGQPYEDSVQVNQMLNYINTTLAPKTGYYLHSVGIIYRADEHGIQHSTAIAAGLTAMGYKVPVDEEYPITPSTPSDFTPYINDLKSAGVDVVMICGYSEGATFLQNCISENYNPKLIFIGPTMETPFLVYGPFGFTPGDMAGVAYYNGWPSSDYDGYPYNTTTTTLTQWAALHAQPPPVGLGYLPFPASATFYCGVQCLFEAVEEHGLNRTAIRDALYTETFSTMMGNYTFNPGHSPTITGTGTLTQWQGGPMMQVVWPQNASIGAAKIIYPKYPWSWASVPDINRDGVVDMRDIGLAAKAFGTVPGDARWNFIADWNRDGKVDMKDLGAIARAFGQKVVWPSDWTH